MTVRFAIRLTEFFVIVSLADCAVPFIYAFGIKTVKRLLFKTFYGIIFSMCVLSLLNTFMYQ